MLSAVHGNLKLEASDHRSDTNDATPTAAPLSCYREPPLYARKPLLIMLTMASFTGNIA